MFAFPQMQFIKYWRRTTKEKCVYEGVWII